MSARLTTTLGFGRAQAARSISSSSRVAAAPPKPKPQISAAARKYGKKKVADEDGGGQSSGNVLEEMRAGKLDLSHLKTFHPEDIKPEAVGQVLAFSAPSMSTLKALTVPPLIEKEFAFTPRPSTVVRNATLKATALLDASKASSSKDCRVVFDGPAGSGKSVLMLQTVSYAQATGWIVLYLPSTTPLVDSSTPHVYSSSTHTFHQPALSSQLLARFFAANKSTLKTIKTTQEWLSLPAGKTLEDLAHLGRDEKNASAVFEAVLSELSLQTQYPVLLALDDSASLLNTSSYKDPSYEPLEAHSLAVPRLLLDYVSGVKSFQKGAILLSPSALSTRKSPALSSFLHAPDKNPTESDSLYRQVLAGVKTFEVPARLERKEAVGVVELVQSWRGLREPMSDQAFLSHFIAADGNAREFSRGIVRNAQL